MTGEGICILNKNEKSYLSKVTLKLIEMESKFMQETITSKDVAGFGVGTVGPGFAIH